MKYAILDPRPTPAALAHNDSIFSPSDFHGPVFGVEVTVPDLASRCGYNLDPQHSDGLSISAIEAAVTLDSRHLTGIEDRTTLVTVRPDLDSVGAMAIIAMRVYAAQHALSGVDDRLDWSNAWGWTPGEEIMQRVRRIGQADSFSCGKWTKREVPTRDNPWPTGQCAASDDRQLAPVAAMCADHSITMTRRVQLMHDWLLSGVISDIYVRRATSDRESMISALESGVIRVDVRDNVAIVTSTHPSAFAIGYAHAPIVIAINPEFSFSGGPKVRKITIGQYDSSWCAFDSLLWVLKRRNPAWGGSLTIIGSPQGESCDISEDWLHGYVLLCSQIKYLNRELSLQV